MKPNKELSNSLNKVMGDVYFTHKGCLIIKLVGGFGWQNQKFLTFQELDKAIDKGLENINKSIVK